MLFMDRSNFRPTIQKSISTGKVVYFIPYITTCSQKSEEREGLILH